MILSAAVRAELIKEELTRASALQNHSERAASFHRTNAEAHFKELANFMGYAVSKIEQPFTFKPQEAA